MQMETCIFREKAIHSFTGEIWVGKAGKNGDYGSEKPFDKQRICWEFNTITGCRCGS